MNIKKLHKHTDEFTVDLKDCIAKTENAENNIIKGMTVEEHCKLTGLISKELVKVIYSETHISPPPNGYELITAIHDIGKVSKPFQEMIYGALSDTSNHPEYIQPKHDSLSPALKHAAIGQIFLIDYGKEVHDTKKWSDIASIVGTHHGTISPQSSALSKDQSLGGVPYHLAREKLLRLLSDELGSKLPEDLTENEIYFLTGLTVVSDWISSAKTKAELDNSSFDHLAKQAVSDAGYSALQMKAGLSFENVFGFTPYPIQSEFFESVKSPGVYILEVEMGMGKTEAALYAAYKLLENGMANGIYFALPTRLTSVSIYKRMSTFIEKITNGESKAKLVFKDSYIYLNAFSENCEPGGDWFDNSKRSILAPFGVGTIDQALMSVINVRHSALRTFGLAGKVLIIDELHSYDEYTGALISELVRQIRSLDGTVIILSATLRSESKQKIIEWMPCNNSYPIITVSNNSTKEEINICSQSNKHIRILHRNENTAIEEAIDHALNGNKVIWIENSVAEAQNIFAIISSRLADTDVEVGLLHSLFTQNDRKRIEDKWIPLFGKTIHRHTKGLILIGTQVLEQSLDIDADFMISRIAPIDMLFQRIGRLWRHRENDATRHCDAPECIIIHPEFEKAIKCPEEAFGITGVIYSPYVLFHTLKTIATTEYVDIPSSIRKMIEDTYKDEVYENSKIEKLHKDLLSKKNEMENRARHANNKAELTEDDNNAKTRYNDEKTSTLILLKSFNPLNKTIEFLDGETITIEEKMSKQRRIEIGVKLLMNSMQIRTKIIPPEAFSDSNAKILSQFIYIGETKDKMTGVLIKEEDGTLTDIFKNKNLEKIFQYSSIMGYRYEYGK